MEQYIPKSALVAWAKETYLCENASMIRKVCYKQLLEHLDTLEVKEVDLDKELNDFIEEQKAWVKDDRVVEYNNGDSFNHIYDLDPVAKHFFELGMSVSNK